MKPPRHTTKTEAVLRALRRGSGLTTASAFSSLGETHLPGTVRRLRRAGHYIEAVWHTGVNRFGTPIRFKRYTAPLTKN